MNEKRKKGGLIFVSCGQVTAQEKKLGKDVCDLIREITPHEPYFAEQQGSLEAFTQNILGYLDKAFGLVAIMHARGTVAYRDQAGAAKQHIRGSVWIEQEIAIAAYIAQILKRPLKIAAYIHSGVKREGMRDKLPLNPIEFKEDSEVLSDLRTTLVGWDAQPVHGFTGAVLEGYLESSSVTSITEGGYRADCTIILEVSVVSHITHRITVSSVRLRAQLEDGSILEAMQESPKLSEWVLITEEKIHDLGYKLKNHEYSLDENQLFPKINEFPLEYGVQKKGWLLFRLNDIDPKALDRAQISLIFEDSLGGVDEIAANRSWSQSGRLIEKSWLT